MKTGKILLAIFLFLAFINESFNAYLDTGESSHLIIFGLLAVVVSGLLIRSALKTRDPLAEVNKPKLYMWRFLSVVSVFGIIGVFVQIITPQPSKYSIEANGKGIPLDKCVRGNLQMIKDIDSRIKYCECLATKLAEYDSLSTESKRLFIKGNFDRIMSNMSAEELIVLGLNGCASFISSLEWTEKMKTSLRSSLVKQLEEVEVDTSYNMTEYCDCLVEGLVQHSPAKVISGKIFESSEWLEIESMCTKKHRNVNL